MSRLITFGYDGVRVHSLEAFCDACLAAFHAAGVRTTTVGWGWHDADRLLAASPDCLPQTPADLLEPRAPTVLNVDRRRTRLSNGSEQSAIRREPCEPRGRTRRTVAPDSCVR